MDEVASVLTTAVISTAADFAPPAKGKRLPSGWCARKEVQRKFHVAWGEDGRCTKTAAWCAKRPHPPKELTDGRRAELLDPTESQRR